MYVRGEVFAVSAVIEIKSFSTSLPGIQTMVEAGRVSSDFVLNAIQSSVASAHSSSLVPVLDLVLSITAKERKQQRKAIADICRLEQRFIDLLWRGVLNQVNQNPSSMAFLAVAAQEESRRAATFSAEPLAAFTTGMDRRLLLARNCLLAVEITQHHRRALQTAVREIMMMLWSRSVHTQADEVTRTYFEKLVDVIIAYELTVTKETSTSADALFSLYEMKNELLVLSSAMFVGALSRGNSSDRCPRLYNGFTSRSVPRQYSFCHCDFLFRTALYGFHNRH